MKYRFSNFYLWSLRFSALLGFSLGLTFLIVALQNEMGVLWYVDGVIIWAGFFNFIYSIRKVAETVIDEKGVRGRYLFRDYRPISWNEMGEVGVGYVSTPRSITYYWFYFSKTPLTREELDALAKIKPPVLKAKYSRRALEAIREFYKGEIRNLSPQVEAKLLSKGKKPAKGKTEITE